MESLVYWREKIEAVTVYLAELRERLQAGEFMEGHEEEEGLGVVAVEEEEGGGAAAAEEGGLGVVADGVAGVEAAGLGPGFGPGLDE